MARQRRWLAISAAARAWRCRRGRRRGVCIGRGLYRTWDVGRKRVPQNIGGLLLVRPDCALLQQWGNGRRWYSRAVSNHLVIIPFMPSATSGGYNKALGAQASVRLGQFASVPLVAADLSNGAPRDARVRASIHVNSVHFARMRICLHFTAKRNESVRSMSPRSVTHL